MTIKSKTIIISGADANYFALAQDFFNSLGNHNYQYDFDLGLLDIGLTEDQKLWFQNKNIHIEPVQSDIEYPARSEWERLQPSCRTFTAKPFLRRYFPGYDVYIWIDADIWIQTPEAIDTMIADAASNDSLHIAMEFDRSYKLFFEKPTMWNVYHEWYQACFNDANVTANMTLKPMLNVGVMAMSNNAPAWDIWTKIYADSLQRLPQLNSKTVMIEQLAMNVALYMASAPYVVLPASYNWLTFFATPMLDKSTGMYVEPAPPYKPISMFHLTQKPKTQTEKIRCTDGSITERPLTYAARNG